MNSDFENALIGRAIDDMGEQFAPLFDAFLSQHPLPESCREDLAKTLKEVIRLSLIQGVNVAFEAIEADELNTLKEAQAFLRGKP